MKESERVTISSPIGKTLTDSYSPGENTLDPFSYFIILKSRRCMFTFPAECPTIPIGS